MQSELGKEPVEMVCASHQNVPLAPYTVRVSGQSQQ